MKTALVLWLALAATARAEDDEPWRPTTSGPFVTFTAPITAKGKLLAQPIASVGFAHAGLDANGRAQPDSLRTSTLALFTELGVSDDLAFGGQLSAIHNEREGAWSYGLGELALFGRRVVHFETARLPEATVLLQLKVPTGNAVGRPVQRGTDLRGSGSADVTLGLDVTKGFRPVLVHADLLLTHPLPARVGTTDVAYGDSLAWALSAEWPFWAERLGVMVELSGRHQLSPVIGGVRVLDGHADEVIAGAGIELLFDSQLQLLVGYQRTVWGRNVSGFDTVIVTLVPMFF